MIRKILAATMIAGVSFAGAARADVISTFAANGVFTDGAVLGGTLTVDATTGLVEAANISIVGPFSYTYGLRSQTALTGINQIIIATAQPEFVVWRARHTRRPL